MGTSMFIVGKDLGRNLSLETGSGRCLECTLCLATGSVMVHRSPSEYGTHQRLMGKAPSPASVSTGWVMGLSVEGDSPCRKQLLRAGSGGYRSHGLSASPVPVVWLVVFLFCSSLLYHGRNSVFFIVARPGFLGVLFIPISC